MPGREQNLRETGGSSFFGSNLSISPSVAYPDQAILFSCRITNDGRDRETVYLRFQVMDSHTHRLCFDSHTSLAANERADLSIYDIELGSPKDLAFRWKILGLAASRHYDARLEVWNPHYLFDGLHPHLFHDSGWVGAFETVEQPARGDVFISYAHESERHKAWLRAIVDRIRRRYTVVFDQYDMLPGDSLSHFMERGIVGSSVRVLICTTIYVDRANAREPGGVGFETILSASQYWTLEASQRKRVIPVLRGNQHRPFHKLPAYLGDCLYVDMSGDDWDGRPLSDLMAAIGRCLE